MLGVIVSMSAVSMGAFQPPKVVLYSGLGAEQAGEVIEELDGRGVDYVLRGDAVLVPPSQRDQLRFALAKDGLPQQSVRGFELLDDVNGFSVTSEMYNAAYWRAKEGELTKTILSIPGVEAVRVHIGASLRSGFMRSQPDPSASVTLRTTHSLSSSQIEGVQYLVALAITGLRPGDVAVIDAESGILAGPGLEASSKPNIMAESQSQLLENKILRLLEARVGAGNARVSVSLDVSRGHEKTSQVTFDPQSRVVRSRTTTDSNQTAVGGGAAITVASNLPQGGIDTPGQSGSVETSTENVVYEVNETRTERETLPGEVRRISVAVVINSGVFADAGAPAGADAGVLEDFRSLIATAAGADIGRGDSVTVELMPFQAVDAEGLVSAPGVFERFVERHIWSITQSLILGLVVLVLALGVVRPLLLRPAPSALELPAPDPNLAATGGDADTIDGTASAPDAFAILRNAAQSRQDETAALLSDWLKDDQPRAVNE